MKENTDPRDEVIDLTNPTEPLTESTEPTEPQPAEPQAAAVSQDEVARLVAEAEQRGYLRALNERARQQMDRPALFENPARRRQASVPEADNLVSAFLSRLPRGVWD